MAGWGGSWQRQMTQRTKDTLKIVLTLIGTIFLAGAFWQETRTHVSETRFVTDSIRRDGAVQGINVKLDQILEGQKEQRDRIREIYCDKARAGCR